MLFIFGWENVPRTRRSQAGPQRSSRRPRCEREMTAQPTSGYQTGAPELLRVAQDAVKEGKGRSPAIARPRPGPCRGVRLCHASCSLALLT